MTGTQLLDVSMIYAIGASFCFVRAVEGRACREAMARMRASHLRDGDPVEEKHLQRVMVMTAAIWSAVWPLYAGILLVDAVRHGLGPDEEDPE